MWKCLQIDLNVQAGELDQAREIQEVLLEELESAFGVESMVQSNFYRISAEMFKARGSPDKFLKCSLLYLTYTTIDDIEESSRPALAFEIGIAAIIGKTEYNFGELMQQPLMKQCLEGSDRAWLWSLLQAFHDGKFASFDTVTKQYASQISAVPDLANSKSVYEEKMRILALMELAFSKPAGTKNRKLAFKEIGEHCRVEGKQIEMMLMRAMSLNLVRGIIDQIDQSVTISWVKPRILDNARIEVMRNRLNEWVGSAGNILNNLEDLTPELLVS